MKGFILYITSLIFISVLYPIAMLYGMFKSFYQRQIGEGWKTIDLKLFYLAIMTDETGNVICKELFNNILITSKSKNLFGDKEETVSSVLGKNQRDNTLSKIGWWLVYRLDNIEKNHCLKSIKE